MSTGVTSRLSSYLLRYRRPILIGAAIALTMAVALQVWLQFRSPARPVDTAADASYHGTPLSGPAPEFRLTDQRGNSVALRDFRGKVVVLTPLDPVCTDICPIYAYHLRLAHEALGADAASVAFLAINANDEKTAVEDVMAATKKWRLDQMRNFHYLTGTPGELKNVWDAYGLLGSGPAKPDKPGEKQHSPAIFVIDETGEKRWFGSTAFEGAPPPSALIAEQVKGLLGGGKRWFRSIAIHPASRTRPDERTVARGRCPA